MTPTQPDFEMLAGIAQHHGLNLARSIMGALADGTLQDLGPCPWPGSILEPVIEPVVERPSVSLAREIQMRLGEA